MRAAFARETRFHIVTIDDASKKKLLELWIDGERFRQEADGGIYGFDGKRYWKRVKGATVALVGTSRTDIAPLPAQVPISLEFTPYLSKLYGTQDDGVLRYLVTNTAPNRLTLNGNKNNSLATVEITLDPETGMPRSESYRESPDMPTDGQPKVNAPAPPQSRASTIALGTPSPTEIFSPPAIPPPFDVSAAKSAWKASLEKSNLGTIAAKNSTARIHRVNVDDKGRLEVYWSGTSSAPPITSDETGAGYGSGAAYDLKGFLYFPGIHVARYIPMRPLAPGVLPKAATFSLPGKDASKPVTVPLGKPALGPYPPTPKLETANLNALDLPANTPTPFEKTFWDFGASFDYWRRSDVRQLTSSELQVMTNEWERYKKSLPDNRMDDQLPQIEKLRQLVLARHAAP